MDRSMVAAFVFTILVFLAVFFQFCLVAGLPWGRLTMGGRHPGTLPSKMRWAAGLQALLLAGLALIVMSRAGLVLATWRSFTKSGVWVVVAICVVSLVMNLVTPSPWERRIWAPVAFMMTVCATVVALGL